MKSGLRSANGSASFSDWILRNPVRFYVVLVLLAVLPTALFSYYADRMLSRQTEEQALNESTQVASLSASFLEDHFRQKVTLLRSYATDPLFQKAWANRDMAEIARQMELARMLDPDSALVSVYELDGTMRAISPFDPEVVGQNFSYRDWYRGVARHWTPYVSEVYRPRAKPQQLSVAVSIPIKDATGKPVGILAAAYNLQRISGWLRQVSGYGTRTISVVDQHGRLLAHPQIDVFKPPVDLTGYEPVQRLQASESGAGLFRSGDREVMLAYVPVPGLGWGVLAEQPTSEVRQRISELRRQVAFFSVLFVVLALACGSLVGSLSRRQQALGQQVQALAASETRYRSLIHGATYGVYRSNEQGFLSANPALVRMLGYESEEELLQLDVARDVYVSPEERAQIMREYRDTREVKSLELHLKRKDGTPITVRSSGRAVRDDQGNFVAFEMICEDVTERKRLEEQLLHSQRLEAVGRLAGGIAHDFNNLLTVISGFSQLVMDKLGESHPDRPELMEIHNAASRAASLTHQLLAFSRQQVLAPKVMNLNEVTHGMENMLRRLLGEDIELLLSLQPDAGRIKADPGQTSQVIMNLAANARDAMPQGGQLKLDTANITLTEPYVDEGFSIPPGKYVSLTATDTGVGMDAEVVAHIFEPFFTTKPHEKGTGLGLATVYGIVKQSGGNILVHSEVGRGSTFRIYLPRIEDPLEPATLSLPEHDAQAGSTQEARGALDGAMTAVRPE
jgi:PAS domain S-box-containing protein